MLYRERLRELEETQRLLVAQSDLRRHLVREEITRLREQACRVTTNPWLLLGAAAGGFFAFRRWRSLSRWLPPALGVWRWLRGWLRK